jgi:hypothetical protein
MEPAAARAGWALSLLCWSVFWRRPFDWNSPTQPAALITKVSAKRTGAAPGVGVLPE